MDRTLILSLAGLLVLMQGVAWLLARGLGRRLDRHVMALGIVAPLLFLAPWFDRTRLLVPSDLLRDLIPEAPGVPFSDRHRLLNDAMLQFLPWELEVRHSLRDGQLPLWSDLLEGGSSPWSNPQAGALSPIAMAVRALPIQHFLLAMLALKILLAFEGTWLLARCVGVSRPASLLAAGGFALSGGMMSWALFPHTATVAWVPWLAAGTILLFREAWSPVRVVTVALLTAALLLSGHPETAAVGGLFTAVCGLSLRARRRSFVRGLGAAALAGTLGFGLAAPHLLPFARLLADSQRAHETLRRTEAPHDPDLRDPVSWFLPAWRTFLLAPISPHIYGRPFQDDFRGPFNWVDANSGYAGLVAFAGSILALLALRRRRAWPFLGFAVVSLLLVSRFIPFARLIDAVEPLRAPAYPRFLLVGCLALAVAGGMGWDRLFTSDRRRLAPALALAAAMALSLAGHTDPYVLFLWGLIVAGGVIGLAAPGWHLRRLGLAVLAVGLLFDQVPWARSLLPTSHTALFYPPSAFLDDLRQKSAEEGPWRVVGENFAVFPSLLSVYGIADVRPHNPLAPMPYLRVLDTAFDFAPTMDNYFPPFLNPDHPVLDFLNVRHVVWHSDHPVPPTFKQVASDSRGVFRLYRNPGALPRWFIPARVQAIGRDDIERWIATLKDGRSVAVFAGEVEERVIGKSPEAARVETLAVSPGRISLRISSPRETLLATSLTSPEGWRARAGDRKLETVLVNGAFLGVVIPAAGEARIELRYLPPGFIAGLALAGISLAVCLGLLIHRRT